MPVRLGIYASVRTCNPFGLFGSTLAPSCVLSAVLLPFWLTWLQIVHAYVCVCVFVCVWTRSCLCVCVCVCAVVCTDNPEFLSYGVVAIIFLNEVPHHRNDKN